MEKLDLWPCEMNWEELGRYVAELRNNGYDHIFEMIKKNPINQLTIDKILADGWNFEFIHPIFGSMRGLVWFHSKTVSINQSLVGYMRDRTIFHELVHIPYGEPLCDSGCGSPTECRNRNAIVEYIARGLRAQPALLRYTIHSLGLNGEIYDAVSCEAFSDYDIDKQLAFPFAQDYFHKLKETILMD